MARTRFDRLAPEKREAILVAAAEEFAAHGYRGASVNRIIEEAGTSKGALYYYVEDKADLLATVLEHAVERMLEAAHWPAMEDLGAEEYWSSMDELFRRSMEQLEAGTWYTRLVWSFHRLRTEPGARDAAEGLLDRSRGLVRDFLERGRVLGLVRDDLPLELLADMFMAADEAGDRWLSRHWSELDEAERAAMIEGRVNLARDMLEARASKGGA